MDLRNNDEFPDLFAEEEIIEDVDDISPIPPSPGSNFWEANIGSNISGDNEDDEGIDLVADEELDPFIIENHLGDSNEISYEYKASFNNFKVNIQCLRHMIQHDI